MPAPDQLVIETDKMFSIVSQLRLTTKKAVTVTPKAVDYFAIYDDQIQKATMAVNTARAVIEDMIDEDSLPLAHRHRRVMEAKQAITDAIDGLRDNGQAWKVVTEIELEQAALPKPSRDQQAVANARQLLDLQLRGSRAPEAVLAAAAKNNDPAAAEAVGAYGRAVLDAAYRDNPEAADAQFGGVRREAIAAAAERGGAAAQSWMNKDATVGKLSVAPAQALQLVQGQTDALVNDAIQRGLV